MSGLNRDAAWQKLECRLPGAVQGMDKPANRCLSPFDDLLRDGAARVEDSNEALVGTGKGVQK